MHFIGPVFIYISTFFLFQCNSSDDRIFRGQFSVPYRDLFVSDSLEFALEVAPLKSRWPLGFGPAEYRLSSADKEHWIKVLPFTLRGAVVTNLGKTAGVAYTMVSPVQEPDEFLNLIILASNGDVILNQSLGRPAQDDIKASPPPPRKPFAKNVCIDETAKRVLFVIRPLDAGDDRVRIYDLDSGALVTELDISSGLKDSPRGVHLYGARLLSPSPLVLFHASAHFSGSGFTLLDLTKGRIVWTLYLPDDYRKVLDRESKSTFLNYLESKPSIVHASADRFTVRMVQAKKLAVYAVARNASGEWVVSLMETRDDN